MSAGHQRRHASRCRGRHDGCDRFDRGAPEVLKAICQVSAHLVPHRVHEEERHAPTVREQSINRPFEDLRLVGKTFGWPSAPSYGIKEPILNAAGQDAISLAE